MSLRRKKRPLARKLIGLEAFFRRELAGNADGDLFGSCIDRAAGLDGVLRLQRLYQLGNVEPHGGELLGGELQVDLLILGADEIDLGNVRNAEQLATQALGMVAQLAMRKAVRGQGEDERIGVAELVVEERTLHALRQGLLDVADLLARLIPQIGHVGRTGGILERHEHHGLAGLGVALQIIEVRQLLELLLDAVGDLLHGLQRRGAWPQRLHHHGLDGEWRVLLAAELAILDEAGERDDQHEVDDEALVLERPPGQVEVLHLLILPSPEVCGNADLLTFASAC